MPHILLVKDMDANVLEKREVPAGANIRTELSIEATKWAEAGWKVERPVPESLPVSFFFIQLGDKRRMVHLVPAQEYHSQTIR